MYWRTDSKVAPLSRLILSAHVYKLVPYQTWSWILISLIKYHGSCACKYYHDSLRLMILLVELNLNRREWRRAVGGGVGEWKPW